MSLLFCKKIILRPWLLLAAMSMSCNLINPAEPVPSYMHIDSISLKINDASKEGSASHKIKDAWVYIDNQPAGVFELPATFPVLYSGLHTVSVKPGILVNGISATHQPYPYFSDYGIAMNLEPGKVTSIPNVTSSYYALTSFPFPDGDFEHGNVWETATGSDTSMELTSASGEVFEGTYSGKISLSSAQSDFYVNTIQEFSDLPKSGNHVTYLEMDYKNTIAFNVGLRGTDAVGTENNYPILTLNPRNEWNKIYVELQPTISSYTNSVKFQLFFSGSKEAGSGNASIYFDNIKIVHN